MEKVFKNSSYLGKKNVGVFEVFQQGSIEVLDNTKVMKDSKVVLENIMMVIKLL